VRPTSRDSVGRYVSEIVTDRLRLRRFVDADLEPLSVMNADPEVMEFTGPTLTRDETRDLLARIEAGWARHGVGLLATELRDSGELAGWIGIGVPVPYLNIPPRPEIGWRLARRFWGVGLATEGAAAVRTWGHDELGIDELVAVCARDNARSRRVMEKIGLVYDVEGDFEHPRIAFPSPLRNYVTYRGTRRGPL